VKLCNVSAAALIGLAAFCAAATTSTRARADVTISEDARSHFRAGVSLLEDPSGARYEEAYVEFKAAYASSPSPKILGNMGLCAMKLERDAEAIKAYDGYLAGVPDAADRQQVQTDLATLKAGLVHVTLKISAKGASIVDTRTPTRGAAVTNGYGPADTTFEMGIHPGNHTMRARLAGFPDASWEFEARPGTPLSHEFTFEAKATAPAIETAGPAVEKKRPIPLLVFIVGGASIAAAGAGTVTGILALGKNSDYKAANDGQHVSQANSLKSSGQTLNVLTDVLFGTAIVGAGVTTYLYLARPSVDAPKTGLSSVQIGAAPGPTGASAFVSGTF
jgi:hypothetical protein